MDLFNYTTEGPRTPAIKLGRVIKAQREQRAMLPCLPWLDGPTLVYHALHAINAQHLIPPTVATRVEREERVRAEKRREHVRMSSFASS